MADLRALTRAHAVLKVAELIVAFVCLGLLRHYDLNFGGDVLSGSFHDRYLTGVITIGGMILVTLPLLISYIWGESGTYQALLEMVYGLVGAVLFITTGALAVSYYHNVTGLAGHNIGAGKALGGLCIFNGFLYLFDTIVAVRHGQVA